jgi:MoaA/NifB/PqqE/SkfB family radical SAM enzyme
LSNEYDEFNSWKTLVYADKCRAILDGTFQAPVVLHVYPTNLCNSNCHFCIMREERTHQATLGRDVFERLMESANAMGIKSLHVSGGGEPTLFKHLDLVAGFKGFKVLSTNGALLTPEAASLFDRVRVSINAGTARVHEIVTGTQNFQKVVFNFWAAKKANPKVQMGLGFVVSDQNWEDIFNVCRLANELEADFIHVRPAYCADPEADKKIREIIEPAYHLCEAARKFSKARIFALSEKFDGCWNARKYTKCLATPLHAVVAATGELIVCQDVFIRFGDLSRQSLGEVWGGPEHKAAIEKIELGKCPRCVMVRPNEILQHVFRDNEIRMEML